MDINPRSILVVLPTWVGDFVMATPSLAAIRQRFPGVPITFLIESNLLDLAAGAEWMDECVTWPAKSRRSPLYKEYRDLVWDLRRRRFDWAVLLPNSFRAALTVWLAGAVRRIGYARDGRGFLLTDRVRTARGGVAPIQKSLSANAAGAGIAPTRPRRGVASLWRRSVRPVPLVHHYADLVEALGCRRPGDRLELFTTPDCDRAVAERLESLGIGDRHPLVVLSPGASYGAAKCWLPERFAAVADRLIDEESAAVIVTCGPGEEGIARQIGAAMKRGGFVFDNPRMTLGQLKSLIRRSDLLICNDSGPRHFAKAFDVAVVTVFGPTHPAWTATTYEGERIVRIDVDCGPCQQRVCPLGHLKCMTGVTVDAVLSAGQELLRLRSARAASREDTAACR